MHSHTHSKPINKDQFVKHFWAVYDTLQSTCDKTLGMPAYFRFLTLLGELHSEGVWVRELMLYSLVDIDVVLLREGVE